MPHLLLVDDDDLFRESLSLNLVDEGYEVTCFDNGQDALAYLNGGSADVMLLDWRMPELTGIDVLRRMRGTGITIPVIFLTVLSDDIYEQAARTYPLDGHRPRLCPLGRLSSPVGFSVAG